MQDGDILLYLDCGCEIEVQERNYMLNCLNVVKTDKIVGTYTGWIENNWNKMDLLIEMDMVDNESLKMEQRQATGIMFLICKESRDLVAEWYRIGSCYHNIDDSPSVAPNIPAFIEHRHDQSIFSLLTKKHGVYCTSTTLNTSCIKTIRNRSGHSQFSVTTTPESHW